MVCMQLVCMSTTDFICAFLLYVHFSVAQKEHESRTWCKLLVRQLAYFRTLPFDHTYGICSIFCEMSKVNDVLTSSVHGRYEALCYGTTLVSYNCLRAEEVG